MSAKFSSLSAELYGFRQKSVDDLSEFNARGVLYEHEQTGLTVYHMETADPENLASFIFRTLPEDDTGVAHILEHTVLCGSQKYPTKDPFLYLAKSSLNTFLNAMTYPDKTVYPVASVVPKDFYNLFRVYADAVFFPLLKPAAFRQEGHRLEWDQQGGLQRSGVVLNEMKGNYSSPESVIYDAVQKSLFDEGPYHYDSGGDPHAIPDLTHQELLAFHQKHYHPSYCLVFLYGNLPVRQALKILSREVLPSFQKRPLPETFPLQKRRSERRILETVYPAAEEEAGTVALAWLTEDVLDFQTILILEILTEALLGDGGVLQKALLESGLGEDVSPVSGLETELREVVFSVGMRGVATENAEKWETYVLDALAVWAREGLPQDLLESVLASFEFSLRELRGGGMGLRYLRRLMRTWLHGATPRESLIISERLERLKEQLKQNVPVFQEALQRFLLDNPHRTLVLCRPDPSVLSQEEEREKELLAELRMKLTEDEIEQLRTEQEELRQFQEQPDTPQAVSALPTLTLRDIPRKVEIPVAGWETHKPFPFWIHETFTNEIAYADVGFDLSHLTSEDWYLLPFWLRCLDSLGTKELTYDLLARKLALTLGGFFARINADRPLNGKSEEYRLWLRFRMLDDKIEEAFSLVETVLTSLAWENAGRLKELLLEMVNDWNSSLVPRGHVFASYRSASGFSKTAQITEWTGGLSQLDYLNSLDLSPEGMTRLGKQCENLTFRLLSISKAVGGLVGNRAAIDRMLKQFETWSRLFPERSEASQADTLKVAEQNTLSGTTQEKIDTTQKNSEIRQDKRRAIPSSVGFNSLTLPASKLGDPGHEAELVLGHLLQTGVLWEEIRMKGGAYGVFASLSSLEGLLTLATFRDPREQESFEAFRHGLEYYREHSLDPQELSNAILGTISGDLAPRSPSEGGFLGLQRSLLGITDSLRQKKRDRMKALKPKDIMKAAERLLNVWTQGSAFSLVPQSTVEDKAQ